jgi:hypothetical protein
MKSMRYLTCLLVFILGIDNLSAQDDCTGAIALCANSTITRSTSGATPGGTDPAITCGDNTVNNNIWFTILAINAGNCTVTVSNINNNPGLEMAVYTGTCGSLTPMGICASGSSATAGSMSVSFPTIAGTQYYVMVDGTGGNQELFDILATTSNNAIVARPDANFNANPSYGCIPLPVFLQNTTTLHGGNNITYEWKMDNGSFVPSSGSDTTVIFNTLGTHTATLRVCNNECGCKTVSQDITVQDLQTSITPVPSVACIGSLINFSGNASVQPSPPVVSPSVTAWTWDFGDPASGASNTASGQNVSHTYNGTGTSYTVRLIVEGTCGPDTTFTTINLLPQPIVNAGGLQNICEGDPVTLSAVVSNATNPIVYSWTGPGSIACNSCSTTTVSGLPQGGPYTFTVFITDANGCTADTTSDVLVHEKPSVFAGGSIQVCSYDPAPLNAIVTGGTPSYTYVWTPSAGLSDPSIANPVATNTNGQSYCVTVTDSAGCTSDPDCITVSQFPKPVINSSVATICATQANRQTVLSVNGADPASTYSWGLSPNYNLITGSTPDSSSVTVSFPSSAGNYQFTARVTDGATGCIDTINFSFTVTAGLNLSVTGPFRICSGDSATLQVNGGITYTWTSSPPYVFADPSLAIQTVSPVSTTNFTITGTTGGCDATINYVLTVYADPVAQAAPIPPVCGCATVNLNGLGSSPGMSYLWSSVNGNTIANSTSMITTAQVCSGDTFNLRVTDNASTCYSDTFTVAVSDSLPVAQANVNPFLICNGSTTTISLDGSGSDSTGVTYHWTSDNPAAIIADTTARNTTADVSTQTVFYLTVTNASGCDSTISDTVFIVPPPVISAINPFICTSDIFQQATIIVNGASPGSNFNWTVPPCVTPQTPSFDTETFDFVSCSAGIYNFSVIVTDATSSCVTTLTQDIQVVNGVVLVPSADTTICEGGSVIMTVSGANTFAWSNGASTDTVVVNGLPASATPYNYTVTGTAGSCTSSHTYSITVNPVPATGAIGGFASACEFDTASSYSVTPATGNYTWSVTGGTITSGQGTSNITVDWDSSGAGFISVVDTNSFGCPGPVQTLNVIIYPLPDTSSITGPATICSNTIGTYNVNPAAGSTFYWSINGGTFVTGQTGVTNNFIFGPPGPGLVSVYEVSAAGCVGPVTDFNVTINPEPLPPLVTGSVYVCDNITEIYSIVPVAGSVYTWNTINALQDSLNTSNDSLYVTWGTQGTGIIQVSEQNSFGCYGDTTNITVNINRHPILSLPVDSASICSNNTYQVSANSNTGNVNWSHDGAGVFNDSTLISPVYIPGTADSGYVHLMMVAENFPCNNDTARFTLYISPAPQIAVTATQSTLCYGSFDTLHVSGTGTYIWTPGGLTDSTIIISPLVTTTYYVSVTSAFSCTTIDSVTVSVIPPGIPDGGPDLQICNGDSVFLNGTQQNAGGVLWSTAGDGVFYPIDNIVDPVYIPGTADTAAGQVTIYIAATGACLNLTDTLELFINGLPSINAGSDTILTGGSSSNAAIPLAPVGNNVTGVIWTTSGTGTFTPSDTSFNATYIPSVEDYRLDSIILTITTAGNCVPAVDFLEIDFAPFIIPNIITPYPSSPGQNDFFEIRNLPPGTQLKIWDRWGLIVFSSSSYFNDWDAFGLKSDVYYYILETETKRYKGWIEVMKD